MLFIHFRKTLANSVVTPDKHWFNSEDKYREDNIIGPPSVHSILIFFPASIQSLSFVKKLKFDHT